MRDEYAEPLLHRLADTIGYNKDENNEGALKSQKCPC